MDTPGPDSLAPSDDEFTVAGIAPVGLDTASADRPPDLHEQQMLHRVMARLEPTAAHQPVRVGRYVLLDPVGTGGMGVVYGGYDDVLDRRVAIKLIRAERAASEAAQLRLVREAQAMAKVTHSGVVAVYEAGVHDGDVYLAMELVEGLTLRGWLRAGQRSWREIVDVFRQIADALAAAHDAGVLHRDFKPDNVLLTRDGRPKVADFGLAHLAGAGKAPMDSSASTTLVESGRVSSTASLSGSRVREARLTSTGDVMGTPAYMSPEQCRGEDSGPASDQFAFFVTMFESLWGERPFPGDTLHELMENIAAGKVRAPRVGNGVPAWVRAIVLRGLSQSSADRYPSMHAVAHELARDPLRARRRMLATGVVLTIGVGGAAAAGWAWLGRERPCGDAEAQLARAWTSESRGTVEAALANTGLSYAADTAARVGGALQTYADAWTLGYVDACEATRVHQVQSEDLLDRRMMCLGRARDELAARTEVLAVADTTIVENAMRVVDGLPSLEGCADIEKLSRRAAEPDDPAIAEAAATGRRELSRAFALHAAGKPDEAERAMAPISAHAHEIGATALAAEADFRRGQVLVVLGRQDTAEPLLRSSLRAAMASGDDGTAGLAASTLVLLLATRRARAGEAQWASDVAMAMATRSADLGVLADVHNSRGALFEALGRADDAQAEFGTMLALIERDRGPDHPDSAVAHENLGLVLAGANRLEESIEHHRRALAIREAELGPEHPRIGLSHAYLGAALQSSGELDAAAHELGIGLGILERALGESNPDVAAARTNLGIVHDERGDHGAAQVEYRAAIAVLEGLYGPEHPDVARAMNNLGASLQDQGRHAEAEVEFRRALAISRAAHGEDHADVARTLGNRSSVLVELGRLDEARAEAEQGLAISARILSQDDPDLAYAKLVTARALFALAKARDSQGADDSPAELAEAAIEHYRGAGDDARDELAAALAWLAATRER